MNLIVPINVQALRVSNNDAAKITNSTAYFSGPTTAFHELPWRDADFNEYAGRLSKANLSSNITTPLAGNISEQLTPGVHLHWALPDALTQGQQADGDIEFPAAPNRWLVTRTLRRAGAVSVKQWVVESDYLMTEDEYRNAYFPNTRRKSVAIPVGWDTVAGTDPRDGGAVYYPPWRRLGKVFELIEWSPEASGQASDPTQVRHLDEFQLSADNLMFPGARLGALRAVGASGPSFAAYYPDCASAFGFHDNFADVDGGKVLDNGAFSASYSVIGWHAAVAYDPLQTPDFLLAWRKAQQDNQSQPADRQLGDAALHAAFLQARYGWSYDAGAGQAQRCLYAGQVIGLPWDTTATLPDLGDPTLPKCYLVPPPPDESVRMALANSASAALAALLQHELSPNLSSTQAADLEFMLDALQLGLLNQIGSAYSMAQLEQALNEHGFSSETRSSVWEIRAKAERSQATPSGNAVRMLPDDSGALATKLRQLNACQQRLDALLAVIRSQQRQLFLDWYKYLSSLYPVDGSTVPTDFANTLRDYLSLQVLDLWAKLEAAFGIKTAASTATRNIPVFCAGADDYLRYVPEQDRYLSTAADASIAGQIAALANDVSTLLREGHPDFELKTQPGAQAWRPHDPIFVATGDSLQPARRNGDLRILPCRSSAQLIAALDLAAGTAKASLTSAQACALTGAQAPALTGNTSTEGDATRPLLDDIAALLGEAALLDPDLADSIGSKLGIGAPGDLQAAMRALLGKISAAWAAGPVATAAPPLPAILDDVQLTVGSVAAMWHGRAPQGLAVTAQEAAWRDPFLPLSLVWEARFSAFEKSQEVAAADYAPDFITEQFALDENVVEFNYGARAPQPMANGVPFSGAVPLSSKAAQPLVEQIGQYLEITDGETGTLRAAQAYLRDKPLLSQALDGLNAALAGLSGGLQLTPFNPFYDGEPIATRLAASTDNFLYENCPTHFVAAAAGDQTAYMPGGATATFAPLRAGFFDIVTVDVVDVFGRKRRLIDTRKSADRARILPASAVKPGVHSAESSHQVYLPPRLTDAARLRFRWLAADEGRIEADSHPATSPICGWIVPNHLDNSLALFSGEGESLGSLGVEGQQSTVTWRSPAGRQAASITEDLASANPTLRDLAVFINGKPRAFFDALNDAIENAHTYILPADQPAAQALAVLTGRPLAVVKAGLRLEFDGLPPLDSSTAALERALQANGMAGYDWTQRDHANLTEVRFPVRLGDRNHLEDGLVAYLLGDAGPFDAIYAPAATANGTTGVVQPAADTVTLQIGAPLDPPAKPYANAAEQIADLRDCLRRPRQQVLTLLVDPGAKVHAATGILPVKAIDLPPDFYAEALRRIAVSFFTHPILRSAQRMELPLPDEPGYSWGWTTGLLQDGVEQPRNEAVSRLQAGDAAQFSYSPQTIEDGWLRLLSEKNP